MHESLLTASGVPVALLSVPLALFVVLAETTIGTVFTGLLLQTRGDLTRGFLKFMALAETGLAVGVGLEPLDGDRLTMMPEHGQQPEGGGVVGRLLGPEARVDQPRVL